MSENGFKLSASKTVCIHFQQKYGFFPDLNILLGKTPIKVAKETKFFGLIFDSNLTGGEKVQYLKFSCRKALIILWVVGHTDCGADRIVLLRLYRGFVRSILDYGCVVYGSARQSIGSDPLSGPAYRVGGFPHISCPKSLPGCTRTVTGTRRPSWHSPSLALAVPSTRRRCPWHSPSETCFELCSEIKISTWKSSLQLLFLKPKTSNYLKTPHFFFNHLSASVSYLTRRNKKLLTLT